MLTVRSLRWDPWNVAHIAKHGVSPDEVEEACRSNPVVQVGAIGRLLVLGRTKAGRILTVVLDPEFLPEGAYYPVTARPASRRERDIYIAEHGGDTE